MREREIYLVCAGSYEQWGPYFACSTEEEADAVVEYANAGRHADYEVCVLTMHEAGTLTTERDIRSALGLDPDYVRKARTARA